MCERTDAAREIEAEARRLRQVCESVPCLIAGEPLRAVYQDVVAEPTPAKLLDLLHRLPEEGRPIAPPQPRRRVR